MCSNQYNVLHGSLTVYLDKLLWMGCTGGGGGALRVRTWDKRGKKVYKRQESREWEMDCIKWQEAGKLHVSCSVSYFCCGTNAKSWETLPCTTFLHPLGHCWIWVALKCQKTAIYYHSFHILTWNYNVWHYFGQKMDEMEDSHLEGMYRICSSVGSWGFKPRTVSFGFSLVEDRAPKDSSP